MSETKEMTLEQAFEELEQLTSRLESNDISLEESFTLYRKGMELLAYCNSQIDTVEKKMLLINQNGINQDVTFSEF